MYFRERTHELTKEDAAEEEAAREEEERLETQSASRES
jgi:hypothetical protein